MSRSVRSGDSLRRIVLIALFGAISCVVMLLIRFPVMWLTLDIKDAVIVLAGLYFGPLAAVALSVIVPLIELIVSDTGFWGLIMNAISTAAFAIPASLIYKYKKDFYGAILALISGVAAMVSVMMLANLLITPIYTGMRIDEIQAWIPQLLLPFNAIKGVLNAALVMMLYKPLSGVLQRVGLMKRSDKPFRFDLRTVIVSLVALVLIVASFVVFFKVLGGSFQFGIWNPK